MIDTDPLAGDLSDVYDPRNPNLTLRQGVVTGVGDAEGPAASKAPRISVALGDAPIAVTNIRFLGPAPLAGDTVWVLGNGADMLVLGSIASPLPTGTVVDYAGAVAPAGWQPCNGAAISRTTYARLFSIVGTTFGSGDGSSTFNVPTTSGALPARIIKL